jgi:hypothetical protein
MVERERLREFTPKEIKFLKAQWKETSTMMLARGADKDEFSEIYIRMKTRIQSMVADKYPAANIHTMVNIYYDLKCTWQKVRSISKGMSL